MGLIELLDFALLYPSYEEKQIEIHNIASTNENSVESHYNADIRE